METAEIIIIDDSAAACPRPLYTTRLMPGGGKLIVSNNPEEVNGQGILYKDRIEGAWRVCVHHQNKTGSEAGGIHQPIQLLVTLTNPGGWKKTINVERSGAAVHADPQRAGCEALQQFLNNNLPCRQEILPAQSLSWGVSYLNYGDTFSGLYDFSADGELEVSVVALFAGVRCDLLTAPLKYFRQHVNPDGTRTVRGTFPYRDLYGRFLYYAGSGWRGVQLGNNPYGGYLRDPWWDWTWSQVYKGEYPAGWNALDRETIYNWGNYGVIYHLNFRVEHRVLQPQSTWMLFNPRGGTYYGPVKTGETDLCPPRPVLPLKEAMLLNHAETQTGTWGNMSVSVMPAGGSSLPVRVLLGNPS